MMVMFGGTIRRVKKCHPAWSTKRMAWAAGATVAAISARCRLIASVLQVRRIGCALLLFRADRSEDVGGSSPLVTRCDGAGASLAQRRVVFFFWPVQSFQVRSLDINFDQIRASVL